MGPYSVNQLLNILTVYCNNGCGNRNIFLYTDSRLPVINHIQPLMSISKNAQFYLNDNNTPDIKMCMGLQSDDIFTVKVYDNEPDSKLTLPYTISKLADELDKLSKSGCGEEAIVLFLNRDPKYMMNTAPFLVEVRQIEIITDVLRGNVVALFGDNSIKQII